VAFGPATTIEVFCDDANDVLLSEGFFLSHVDIRIFSNYPIQSPSGVAGWRVAATSIGAPGFAQSIAHCLRVD